MSIKREIKAQFKFSLLNLKLVIKWKQLFRYISAQDLCNTYYVREN